VFDLSETPGGRSRRSMRRGAARLLVLNVLSAGPRHGYGIARQISEDLRGGYDPSPGVIYPTLQVLDDLRLVRGKRTGDRFVYSITAAGRTYLARHRPELELVLRWAAVPRDDPSRPITRAADRLRRTILLFVPEMSGAQRIRVARILDGARTEVTRLMEAA